MDIGIGKIDLVVVDRNITDLPRVKESPFGPLRSRPHHERLVQSVPDGVGNSLIHFTAFRQRASFRCVLNLPDEDDLAVRHSEHNVRRGFRFLRPARPLHRFPEGGRRLIGVLIKPNLPLLIQHRHGPPSVEGLLLQDQAAVVLEQRVHLDKQG